MYILRRTKSFEKSFRKIVRAGDKHLVKEIEEVLGVLLSGKTLSARHRDHSLTGEYAGYRECHVRPDVLLIYVLVKEKMILVAIDIGSHSNLFD